MDFSSLERLRRKVEAGEPLSDAELESLRTAAQNTPGPTLRLAVAHALVNAGAEREALRLLRKRPLLMWSDLTSLTSLAQACLELWEEARGTGDAEPRALATAALRVLRKTSRLQPTARSRTARLEGTYAWLEGRTGRAQVLWQRALELASTWRMPTDEGLAHYELARTSAPGGARELHLARARHIFEHLDATGSLRALDALEQPRLPAPAKASAG